MFFEGSEKKLEVIIQGLNLRELGQDFWAKIVSKASARILSSVHNDKCDAYLLSESSLFVWDDRFLVLTCGKTTLVESLIYFIDKIGKEKVSFVSFQRKNEYLSNLQMTSFADDLKKIRSSINGQAVRIGHLDSHHHYIFTTDIPYDAPKNDTTSELLMYHIGGEVADYLRSDNQTKEKIRSLLELDKIFPNFLFDDYLFNPFGYSINGVFENKYFTIHITPQENSSYVSFETNIKLEKYEIDIFAHLLSVLNPGSWDVIGFNSTSQPSGFPQYICLGSCRVKLTQGYNIDFSHYQQPCHEILVPEVL